MNPPPNIALIACEVFLDELEMITEGLSHIVVRHHLEIALHDRPDEMRTALQTLIDEADARNDIDAIVLAYGLCGCGTADLHAEQHPLVIPRAHDCITVLLGSKELYAERQASCLGCHHYSPGWNRARRVPGPERLEIMMKDYSDRFGPDDAEFLLESERDFWKNYHTATFIDLGTPGSSSEAEYARHCADWLGWKFEHLKGDPTLLRDLLTGPWDDQRFLVVPPGGCIAHSPDSQVMKVAAREALP